MVRASRASQVLPLQLQHAAGAADPLQHLAEQSSSAPSMGGQQGGDLPVSSPSTGSAPAAADAINDDRERVPAYDVSAEQAGPYRGRAPATAPPCTSSEDVDLNARPDDSLGLPPPAIHTVAAAPGRRAHLPAEHEARAGVGGPAAAESGAEREAEAAAAAAAGGARPPSPSEEQVSPSKRSSALDVTGAAIIKSAPGEGRASHLGPHPGAAVRAQAERCGEIGARP